MKSKRNLITILFAVLFGSVFQASAQDHSMHGSAMSEPQFLEMMTKHHQDGIEMAKMAKEKATNKEVKNMSEKIIKDQSKDIAKLQSWKKKWHANEKVSAEMPKMDMSKLQAANGKEFDQAFLDMMSQHHQHGVAMAKDAKLEHKEVKDFAEKSVKKQTAEISKMEEMKTSLQ